MKFQRHLDGFREYLRAPITHRGADACHAELDPAVGAQVLPLSTAWRLHPPGPYQRAGVPQGGAEADSECVVGG